MFYFVNPGTSLQIRAALRAGLMGYIQTPRQRNLAIPGVEWCADNAVYGKGFPGDDAWAAWLDARPFRELCRFATAPDVVGDAGQTLDRSMPWLPMIRAIGYPAALVAQDGLESLTVPWSAFDVLFIGGSTEWKLGAHARRLVVEAHRHGKPVHMGRVNSEKRFVYAHKLGVDTADGTILTFGPDKNLPRVLRMIRHSDQYTLDLP